MDYFDTFAHVTTLTAVRTVLAIASAKCWFISQLDIPNAFLNGDLQEELYMQLPQGYGELLNERNENHSIQESTQGKMVCRLFKSIFGLKQASMCWY